MLLAAALEYAGSGLPVFPIWGIGDDGRCLCGTDCGRNAGKHPNGRLAPRGLLDASVDEDVVRAWWTADPECNVGLATGHGLFVVDCDRKPGIDGLVALRALERSAGELDLGAQADTGGGGVHLFFAADADAPVGCRNGWRPGVDIKGVGGYVVAPPSRHASGKSYAWRAGLDLEQLRAAPPWLLALVAGEVPPRGEDPPAASPSAPTPQHGLSAADVAEYERALELIPANCDRQTWVERVSMPLHDVFHGSEDGFLLWHRWCASASGQVTPNGNPAYGGERECRTVWRSFSTRRRNPRGRATFWQHAMACGYHAPGTPAPATNGMPASPVSVPAQHRDDELQPWREPDRMRVALDCPRLDMDAAYPPELLWLRDYVSEIARLVQVRAELPALLSLGLASGSYGRVFRLRLANTDWVEYSPLWVICAFASGGGKSPVFRPLREPFTRWDITVGSAQQPEMDAWAARRDLAHSRLTHAQAEMKRQMKRIDDLPVREKIERDLREARTGISVVEELRPRSKRVLASSLTTPALVEFLEEHQERCLIVDPEGGIFQYVLGGRTDLDKDLDPWLKSFSCETIQQHRVGDGKKAKERLVRWPALSMAICTQVTSLRSFADQYSQGKGFLARFIPAAFVGELPQQAIVSERVPRQLQQWWSDRIHTLLSLPVPQHEPREVELDGDGLEMFRRWMQDWLDRARSDEHQDEQSPTGWGSPSGAKLRSQALRIILLMHVLTGGAENGDPVDPRIVDCVLRGWMPFIVASTANVLGVVRDDVDLQIADRVLRFLARRNGHAGEPVTRHAIYENLKSGTSTHAATIDCVSRLNGALAALVDAGWLQPASRVLPRGAGFIPAASRYAVHPEFAALMARHGHQPVRLLDG